MNGLVILLLMCTGTPVPCAEATRMRAGDVATCEGILVPDSDVRDLLTLDAEFGACTAGLNACQQARELERAAWEREVELLLAGRADPAPAPVHERGFGWAELFVGLGAGLLVGGAVTWGILASH